LKRRLLVLAVAALLAACDNGPKAGTLTLALAGPQRARSVKFRLVGPQTDVAEPTGSTLGLIFESLPGDTTVIAVFAPVGDSVNGGTVALIQVPDVHASGSYHAEVLEVASPSYVLHTASQYVLTVSK